MLIGLNQLNNVYGSVSGHLADVFTSQTCWETPTFSSISVAWTKRKSLKFSSFSIYHLKIPFEKQVARQSVQWMEQWGEVTEQLNQFWSPSLSLPAVIYGQMVTHILTHPNMTMQQCLILLVIMMITKPPHV